MKNIKNNQLLSSSVLGLLIKGGNTVLLFLVNILVARLLGEQGFGQFSLLLTIFTIGTVFFQFGFPDFIISSEKYTATSEDNKRFSFNIFLTGIFLATCLLAAIVLSYWLGLFSQLKTAQEFKYSIFLQTLIASYFGACILLTNAYLRAKGQSLSTIVTDQLVVPLIVLFGVIAVWKFSNPALENLIQVYLVANVLGTMLIVTWLKYCDLAEHARISEIKTSLLRYDVYLSMGAVPVCLLFLYHMPILFLAFSEHAEHLAVFRVAYLLSLPLLLVVYPINVLAGPYIAKAHQARNYNYLNTQLVTVVRVVSMVGVTYSIAVTAISQFIIDDVFEFESTQFRLLVFLMLLNNLFALCFGPVGLVLHMVKMERFVLLVLLVTVILSGLLMKLTVNSFGMLGLAFISAIATLVWKFILLVKIKKKLDVDCSIFSKKFGEKHG